MAFIHDARLAAGARAIRQAGLMAAIIVASGGFMIATSRDLEAEGPVIVIAVSLLVMMFLLVALKKYPLAFMRVLRRARFDRMAAARAQVFTGLERLDENCHVFSWIFLELFRIEHLVVSPHGVFVIKTVDCGGDELHVRDQRLFAGDRSLERETGKLWRICHLIAILIKKGFKADVMPVPLLVPLGPEPVSVEEFQGVGIVLPSALSAWIERFGRPVPPDISHGFAWFMKSRYV